jgi:hypothetical protein
LNEAAIGTPADAAAPRHWLDEERLRIYPLLILAIFGLTLAWWTWRSLPGLVDPNGKPLGSDFIAFWSAARLALEGRPEAAFDWSALAAMHHVAVPQLPADKLFLWHYPPTYLLLVLPLGLLPYLPALGLFTIATAGLWAALVPRVLPHRRAWLAAAALPAGLVSLMHGQNGFLTAVLAGFALLALDRRPLLSGLLIGLLAIKPHLAALFPIALVAERRWPTIAAAAATALVLTAVSIAAFGLPTMAAFLRDLAIAHHLVNDGLLPWGKMPSPYVFALSLGMPAAAAMALQAIVAAASGACVWIAWRAPRAPFEAKAAVLVVGSLLVSPYVFHYDLTWAGLAIGWLAVLGVRQGFLRGERELLFAAWISPLAMDSIWQATAVQIGFPLLAAVLAVAMIRAIRLDAQPGQVTAGRRYRR